MKLKKRYIVLISIILVLSILLGVFFYLKNRDVVDTTDANMEFVINDTLENGNGEKVKVILLAGQSNASGVAHTNELVKNISEDKFLEYETGYENIFINYYNDNGSNKSLGFTNVKINQGCVDGYFGPELGMGEKLSQLYPNEKIFIIKYAWGGSNLHTQWDYKNGNLYKAFIKFTKESMEYLESKNYDAEIVSMMWMQGESDASPLYASNYKKNLTDMIAAIRKDLKDYIASEEMYFIDAYISSSPYWIQYKTINKAKQAVCDSSSLNICVDTIEEGLTYDKEPIGNADLAHYDSLSEIKLGHLFIEAFAGI